MKSEQKQLNTPKSDKKLLDLLFNNNCTYQVLAVYVINIRLCAFSA